MAANIPYQTALRNKPAVSCSSGRDVIQCPFGGRDRTRWRSECQSGNRLAWEMPRGTQFSNPDCSVCLPSPVIGAARDYEARTRSTRPSVSFARRGRARSSFPCVSLCSSTASRKNHAGSTVHVLHSRR